jgi:hypothetical protein
MIPQTRSTPVQMGGLNNSVHEATIENSVQVFDMFIDSTYPDKVLAAAREPIQNAIDAHTDAGIEDTPLEIHLPTTMTPEFIVRDFGYGMSEEMIRIGMSLGGTTKNARNDLRGGKGIGFMAVFAYTDGFTIETVYEGMKSTYRMFRKEENRMPSTIQIGTAKPSNEPSGTAVRVAVDPDDYGRFRDAVRSVTSRFFEKPKITGDTSFEFEKHEYAIEGDGWAIRMPDTNQRSYNYQAKPCVIMGNLSYPIDAAIMNTSGARGDHMEVLNTNLEIVFGIGELEVATSREGLSYNAQTVNALEAKIRDVHRDLKTEVEDKLKVCATGWEANKVLNEALDSVSHLKSLSNSTFAFNGKPMVAVMNVKGSDVPEADDSELKMLQFGGYYACSGMRKHETWKLNIANSDTRKRYGGNSGGYKFILVHDKQNRVPSRLQAWRESLGTFHGDFVVLMCDNKDDIARNKRVVLDVIDRLGNPPYINMDDIPDVAAQTSVVSSTGTRSTTAKVTEFTGYVHYHDSERKKSWKEATVDIDNETGYYVDLRKWAPTSFNSNTMLKSHINYAKAAGVIPAGTVVYGVPGAHKNPMKDHANWTEFRVHLASETKVVLDKLHASKDSVREAEELHKVNERHDGLLALMAEETRLNPLSLLHLNARKFKAMASNNINMDAVEAIKWLCMYLDIFDDEYDSIAEIVETKYDGSNNSVRDALYKQYPLLQHMTTAMETSVVNDFVEYINQKGEK